LLLADRSSWFRCSKTRRRDLEYPAHSGRAPSVHSESWRILTDHCLRCPPKQHAIYALTGASTVPAVRWSRLLVIDRWSGGVRRPALASDARSRLHHQLCPPPPPPPPCPCAPALLFKALDVVVGRQPRAPTEEWLAPAAAQHRYFRRFEQLGRNRGLSLGRSPLAI
jgi:hypothetical protein